MSKNKKQNGTFIHGIAASEHLDSSGERIMVEGIDISSLTKDGVFNWEHKNDTSSQIVGKILEAKKILKRADCDTEEQKYFWDLIKTPYVYVAGELFDHVGHTAAQDVAAMLKYDKGINKSKTKALVNFSIEGSRLGKSGSTITKCIARKVTVTITPCNKMAFAEHMDKSDKNMGGSKEAMAILDKFKKSELVEIEILEKSAKKYYTQLYSNKAKPNRAESKRDFVNVGPTRGEQREGSEIKPKKTYKPEKAPEKIKIGDRIDHAKPRARTGKEIYNDPDTFKTEKKPKKKKLNFESNVRKTITASAGLGAPSSLSGGAALASESLDKKMVKTTKKSKKKVMKTISEDSWSRFTQKDKIIEIFEGKAPELSKNEILALAKSFAYYVEKKDEINLHSLMKNENK